MKRSTNLLTKRVARSLYSSRAYREFSLNDYYKPTQPLTLQV